MSASLAWFARHELRLTWRDTATMLQGGRRGRGVGAIVALVVFALALHAIAYVVIAPSTAKLLHPDKALLVSLSGSAFLTWMLLLSQAMETVTRSFYTRADLDLILSSPADARRLFAIRILANALASLAMAALVVGPAIDVAALRGGPRFLCAYGLLVAMAASGVALAVCATALLFRIVGPKRTRLLAQIAAAVIGAGFVIWIQIAAILSYGSLSRTLMFRSPQWIAAAPDLASPVWGPAHAAMGDLGDLTALLAGGLGLLALAIMLTAPAFARNAITVAGLPSDRAATRTRPMRLRPRSQAQSLRAKEWTLLWRDPWLVSQSLMQVLYLLPPALLLWRDFGTDGSGLVVLVPVLVMAAGQLAGGLAWLAISGEDAPDLVATAPLGAKAILRAKIEAVMAAVTLPIVPIAAAMAFASPFLAVVTILGAGLGAGGASAVQFFFRSQAKRSSFRRRQTSSRIATFAEAFLSISIAAAAGLAAAQMWLLALIPLVVAAAVLGAARAAAGTAQSTMKTTPVV